MDKFKEWARSKIITIRPLNEYPQGEFLPFKSKNGLYMYLHSILSNSCHIKYYKVLNTDSPYHEIYRVENNNTIRPSQIKDYIMDEEQPI